MEAREAVIVDTARTAIGKRKGALANWHPTDLLGFALKSLLERNDVDPGSIDDVVGGCVTQSGEQGCNVTRNAWVAGGLPWHVPATSVDRQCGSSQQAMHFVAQGVIAGAYDLAIACGVESMTRAPMSTNARGGTGPFSPSFLENTDHTLGIQFWVAQVLADRFGITRDDMDAFALESHRRAAENTDNGFFADEVLPVPLKDEHGQMTGDVLRADEAIRPHTSLEQLAGLPAAWESDEQPAPDITAGNASPMSDGAAAMLIADRSTAERLGLPIRARFVHFAVLADDPVLVLSAPNPVTRKLLDRTGLKVDEFDAIECNEAFAAIALMWAKEFR
ncbi:MAG: thiolase family protein, partial [Actinomycetota bacterium]|nr:thiolase family protein [Actinomycetota bacterium]